MKKLVGRWFSVKYEHVLACFLTRLREPTPDGLHAA